MADLARVWNVGWARSNWWPLLCGASSTVVLARVDTLLQ